MKILIITDAWHPQVNGVVRTYEYLGSALQAMGHNVHVIGPADFPHSIPMPGYAEIRLTIFPYRRLATMISAFAPDCLHIGTEGPLGWAARRYARKHHMPFTSCYHTQFPDYAAARMARFIPSAQEWVRQKAISFIKTFHAPSMAIFQSTDSIRQVLRSWGFKQNLPLMTRGVDTDIFYPGEKTVFHGLPRPIALYVGRIAIEKNLESFLCADWPGSKVIVGDGPQLEELQKNFPEAHFLGKKTGQELADCYRSADIFAFPSLTDTFGMVLIEALACGLPVAGYPVSGPADIITSPLLGAIDKDFSAAMRYALNAPGSAQDRFVHVQSVYGWHKAAQQFMGAYING